LRRGRVEHLFAGASADEAGSNTGLYLYDVTGFHRAPVQVPVAQEFHSWFTNAHAYPLD
jgi:hypothetical protein